MPSFDVDGADERLADALVVERRLARVQLDAVGGAGPRCVELA